MEQYRDIFDTEKQRKFRVETENLTANIMVQPKPSKSNLVQRMSDAVVNTARTVENSMNH
ncbi:10971_t:CDS:2 [Diversispora eburnea]|uniref:10971_t:CDS:1 n=1 Tax=Diversispora eburnea TaxID=1213867 RepID=A0A9N9CA37_9GLOM|nr:10971_t:CDS:2 [Diversispora eburnea]